MRQESSSSRFHTSFFVLLDRQSFKKGEEKYGESKIEVGKRERRKNGHKVIHLMARHMISFTREVLLSRTHCLEVLVFCLKESVRNDTECGSMDFPSASTMP